MNCKQIQDKLIFLIEGDLNINDSEILNKHIESCKDCQFLFNQLRASMEFLDNDKLADTNPFFITRVLAGLESKPKELPLISWIKKKQYSLQLLAYSILIIVAVTFGNYLGQDKTSAQLESVSQNNEVTDNQLFAESYQFQLSEADAYLINAE